MEFVSASIQDVSRRVTGLKSEDLTDARCKNQGLEMTFIIFSDEWALRAQLHLKDLHIITPCS